MKFDKMIIIFCISVIILFTCYVCYINSTGGEVSDVLIEKIFDFFGIEVLALAGIKVGKVARDTISSLKNIKE